jgi:hypothetical protein
MHILYSKTVFRKLCGLWDNAKKIIVEPDRSQMKIWSLRFECWVPKATNTQSEYVIFISFPLQQWLQQRASMLRYECIACPVYCVCKFASPHFLCNEVYVMYLHVLLACIWQLPDDDQVSWPKSVAILRIKKCAPRKVFSWNLAAPLSESQYNSSFLLLCVPSRCAQVISKTGRIFSQAQHLNYNI